MRPRTLLLGLGFLLIVPIAHAQLGTTPLLPEGQLNLTVGAFHDPGRDPGTFYGAIGVTDTFLAYTGIGDYDERALTFNFGFDGKPGALFIASGGFQVTKAQGDQADGFYSIKTERDVTGVVGRMTVQTEQKFVFATQISAFTYRTSAKRSTVVSSAGSVSTSHSLVDVDVGFSSPLAVDSLRIGAAYTPEASSTSNSITLGHGAQSQFGIGFSHPRVALGVDLYMTQASTAAESPAATGTVVSGELLLSADISILGRYETFASQKLEGDGEDTDPSLNGTAGSVTLAIRGQSTVWRIFVFRSLEKGGKGGPTSDGQIYYIGGEASGYGLSFVHTPRAE